MNTALLAIVVIGFVVAIATTTVASFVTVEPSHKAVVLTLGKVEDRVLSEGLNQITPFWQTTVSIRIADNLITANAPSGTKDLLSTNTEIALQYAVKPDRVKELYVKYLGEHETILLTPAIQEVTKQVTAYYEAPELITKRDTVKADLEKRLQDRIESTGFFIVSAISITDFGLPPSYLAKVLEKENSIQEAQNQRNLIEVADAKAQQRIAEATGNAEAIRLEAEAVRDNPEYMNLLALQKWNGKLPFVTGDSLPMINLDNILRDGGQ